MDKINLSILLVPSGHHRIRYLHKTILNIRASINKSERPLDYSISVLASDAILNYIKNYPSHDIVIHDDFDKYPKSNSSNFTMVIEEGSLVSTSWISDALSVAITGKDSIIHTRLTILREINCIWEKVDSTVDTPLISLPIRNQWDLPFITASDNLHDLNPIHDLWLFNQETLARNIEHIAIPESIHISRSLPEQSNSGPIAHSSLYESKRYKNLSSTEHSDSVDKRQKDVFDISKIKEKLRKSHVWMKTHSRAYKSVAMPLLRAIDKKVVSKKIPDWALKDWIELHSLDRTTFPTRDILHSLSSYSADEFVAGNVFMSLNEQLSSAPDYIFMSQHMMKGGGDKVVLNYVNTLRELRPDWTIALLITEPFVNNWKDRVPNDVAYIDFGNAASNVRQDLKHLLLARITVQSKTRRFMLAMTPFGFEMVEKYPNVFSRDKYQIDSVAFCSDVDSYGRTWGIHFFGIPETFESLHGIYTDNQKVIDETLGLEPLMRDRFTVHYQPVHYKLLSPKVHKKKGESLNILWASRIAKQKRPDIVTSIARAIENTDHHIDMYGNLEDGFSEHDLSGISSLSYCGGFDGFDTLPLDDYDALLYTSSFDGVPNILLEATAMGLPIIAPNVGGVSEFIKDHKTGLLIDNIEDVAQFSKAISFLSMNPDKARKMVQAAQKLLKSQHSYNNFSSAVERDLAQ